MRPHHPSVLSAKIRPPVPRLDLVARPRLFARRRGDAQLTLIVAPAGFGKTTAALQTARSSGLELVWLSLDSSDDDPARFLATLVAAVERALHPVELATRELLGDPQIAVRTVIECLLDDLAGTPRPLLLVIDDYHVITAEPIHTAITTLVDYLPPNHRLVLVSRTDPPMPLARWRARGMLAEIRADDLRLTLDETAELLRHQLTDGLSDSQTRQLVERTGGWAAALQLAALALRDRADPEPFLHAFGGAHPALSDYLADEVLDGLAEELRTFLLETAVLTRLYGPLCDTVTGRSDSARLLDTLLRRSGLIGLVSLVDQTEGWFQCHALLHDFLHARLVRDHPGRARELHRRAAHWYAERGWRELAVPHALESGDMQHAAALVASVSRSLMQTGEIGTLQRWLAALPESQVIAHAHLCLAQLWTYAGRNRVGEAPPALMAALEQLDAGDPQIPTAEALALLSFGAAQRHNGPRAAELARRAEQRLDGDDAFAQAHVALALAGAYKTTYANEQAEHSFLRTESLAELAGDRYLSFLAAANLANMQVELGRLSDALPTCRRALARGRRAGVEPPYTAMAHWTLAVIAYEQNDLEQAELSAQRAALLCRDWDNAAMAMRVELTRAQIAAAQGERSAAQAILDDAERLARDSRDPRRSRLVLRWRLRLALAVSDMVSARRWLEGIVALNLGPPHYVVEISLGRFALADGHPDRACEHLGRARAELEQMHYVPVLIETLLLESLARFSRRPTGWLAPLGRALELGHAGGFLRTFLDEGPEVLSLLRRSALMPEYVDQLLVAGARPSSDLTEIHLTDRERQILYLLSAGLSNRDLADRLVIAESTLKRHISNLYLKLAVHSRTQALARASELRLL